MLNLKHSKYEELKTMRLSNKSINQNNLNQVRKLNLNKHFNNLVVLPLQEIRELHLLLLQRLPINKLELMDSQEALLLLNKSQA